MRLAVILPQGVFFLTPEVVDPEIEKDCIMSKISTPPPGTGDIFPDEVNLWLAIENAARRLFVFYIFYLVELQTVYYLQQGPYSRLCLGLFFLPNM